MAVPFNGNQNINVYSRTFEGNIAFDALSSQNAMVSDQQERTRRMSQVESVCVQNSLARNERISNRYTAENLRGRETAAGLSRRSWPVGNFASISSGQWDKGGIFGQVQEQKAGEQMICIVKDVKGGVIDHAPGVTMETKSDDEDCIVVEDDEVISIDSDDEVVVTGDSRLTTSTNITNRQASLPYIGSNFAKAPFSPMNTDTRSGQTMLFSPSGRVAHSTCSNNLLRDLLGKPSGLKSHKSNSMPSTSANSTRFGEKAVSQLLAQLKKSVVKKKVDIDKISADLEKSRVEPDISIIAEMPVAASAFQTSKIGQSSKDPETSRTNVGHPLSVFSRPNSGRCVVDAEPVDLEAAAQKGRIDKIITDLEDDIEGVDLDMSVVSEPSLDVNTGFRLTEQGISVDAFGKDRSDEISADLEKSTDDVDLDMSVVSEPVLSMNVCLDDSEYTVTVAPREKSDTNEDRAKFETSLSFDQSFASEPSSSVNICSEDLQSTVSTDAKERSSEKTGEVFVDLNMSIESEGGSRMNACFKDTETAVSTVPEGKHSFIKTARDSENFETAGDLKYSVVSEHVYGINTVNERVDNQGDTEPAVSDSTVTSSWNSPASYKITTAESVPDDINALHTHYSSSFIKREIKQEHHEYVSMPAAITEVVMKPEPDGMKTELIYYKGEEINDTSEQLTGNSRFTQPEKPVPLSLISYVNNPENVQDEHPPQQESSLQIYLDIDEGGSVLGRDCIPSAEVSFSETAAGNSETEEGVLCLLCNLKYPKQEINRHLSYVHCKRNYKCGMCHMLRDDKDKLLEHFKVWHNSTHWFLCVICGTQFGTNTAAKRHFAKLHNLCSEPMSSVILRKEMKYAQKIVDQHAAYIHNYAAVFGEESSTHLTPEEDKMPSGDIPKDDEGMVKNKSSKQSPFKNIPKSPNLSELKDKPKETNANESVSSLSKTAQLRCKKCKKIFKNIASISVHLKRAHKQKRISSRMYTEYVAGQDVDTGDAKVHTKVPNKARNNAEKENASTIDSESLKPAPKNTDKDKYFRKDSKVDTRHRFKCYKCPMTFASKLLCYNHVKSVHKIKGHKMKQHMYSKKVKSQTEASDLQSEKTKSPPKESMVITKSQKMELRVQLETLRGQKFKEVEVSPSLRDRQSKKVELSPSLRGSQSKNVELSPSLSGSQSKKVELSPSLKGSHSKNVEVLPSLTGSQSKKVEFSPSLKDNQFKKVELSSSPSSDIKHKATDLPSTSTPQAVELNKVYQCKLCGFFVGGTRQIPKLLFTHIANDHSVVRFSCKECTYCTNDEEVIIKHVSAYHVCMQYECTLCKTVCSSEISVLHHMESRHSNASRSKINYQMYSKEEGFHIKYDDIFTNFYQEVNLSSDHSSLLISLSNQTKCNLCGLIASAHSSSQSLLEHHLVSEHKVSKYRCKACSFSSSTESEVQLHLGTCPARSTKPLADRYESLDLSAFTSDVKPLKSDNRSSVTHSQIEKAYGSSNHNSSDSGDASSIEIRASSSQERGADKVGGLKRKWANDTDEKKKKRLKNVVTKKNVSADVKKSGKAETSVSHGSSGTRSVKSRERCVSEGCSSSSSTPPSDQTMPTKMTIILQCSFKGCQYETTSQNEKEKHEQLHKYSTIYKCSLCSHFYCVGKSGISRHLQRLHKNDSAFVLVSNDKGLTYYPESDTDSSSESSE